MRTYRFDIFIGEKYKATLVTKAPPRWVFGEEELVGLVEARYPSLKGRNWRIG
ncbi:MAG: hypothetical protein K6G25_06185 [Bacteroidales bacterium]|nr:hypothetical protein [Bacteroidales bacterium]